MKTIKFLSMMLVMLAMSVCMAGCSNDDDDSEFVGDSASIVGSWVQTNEYDTLITLYFKADKTGALYFKADKTGVINYTYSDMSGDSNENFEYDYIEKDRSLVIIGSQLSGSYYVTLTATKLILSDGDYSYAFTRK